MSLDPWKKECQRRRSELDPELLVTASKLVEQVLAKVVAEECMRIPSTLNEVCAPIRTYQLHVQLYSSMYCTCACL